MMQGNGGAHTRRASRSACVDTHANRPDSQKNSGNIPDSSVVLFKVHVRYYNIWWLGIKSLVLLLGQNASQGVEHIAHTLCC